jgi:glutathionylspermidine synthase
VAFSEVQAAVVLDLKYKPSMHFKNLSLPPSQMLAQWGYHWLLGTDTMPYVHTELVQVTEQEAQAYLNASNQLYTMYVAAAEYVVAHKLYSQLGIDPSLIPIIEYTWQHDNHWHIYGRFDLAGGLDGLPIKLIEFNADTATCLPETALVQWASLLANKLDNSSQCNNLFDSLVAQFIELKTQNPNLEPYLLLSGIEGSPEDDANLSLLAEAAKEAGFTIAFDYVENVEFSAQEGVFKQNNENGGFEKYDFWMKLIPWEYIAADEPELLKIISDLVCSGRIVVLNPAYTLLFQSKGILKILWDLYPNHPLLLETRFERLIGQKCVQKTLLGREGANVQIINEYGRVLKETEGEYTQQSSVYQLFAEFATDTAGRSYQAGLFFAGEACALGFRFGRDIIDNQSQFCGHIVQ